MNIPMAVTLILLTAGCAHSEKKASPPELSTATVAPASESSAALSPTTRMPLPYTFSRRGIKVRVNSVEFAQDKLQVSVTLEEVRGETGFVLASTLMEPRSAVTKKTAPYAVYMRNGQEQMIPQVNLSANEKFTIDLLYQLSPDMIGNPMEIQFTTGKWWSSQNE